MNALTVIEVPNMTMTSREIAGEPVRGREPWSVAQCRVVQGLRFAPLPARRRARTHANGTFRQPCTTLHFSIFKDKSMKNTICKCPATGH